MNESITDERGLMSTQDFQKMLFTFFGRIDVQKKKMLYDSLIEVI
jgi:hypothetical protein